MADELISRQALKDNIGLTQLFCVAHGDNKSHYDIIHEIPAADAVEVSSCDGCIWSNRKRPQKCSCCRRNLNMKDCYSMLDVTPDGFCSYGERKEGDD